MKSLVVQSAGAELLRAELPLSIPELLEELAALLIPYIFVMERHMLIRKLLVSDKAGDELCLLDCYKCSEHG